MSPVVWQIEPFSAAHRNHQGPSGKNYDKYWGRYFGVSSKVQYASHVVVASAINPEPSTTAAVVVFFACQRYHD